MTVSAKPDDALAFRLALEPLTKTLVGNGADGDGNHIALVSIAISLRRIADSLERSEKT